MGMCDNFTTAPWSDLIVNEDGPGEQYIRGVTPAGHIYTIARNAFNETAITVSFVDHAFLRTEPFIS